MIDSNTPATDQQMPSRVAAMSVDTPSLGDPKSRQPARTTLTRRWMIILAMLIVLVLGLTTALWMQRQQFLSAGREIAHRLDSLNSALNQTQTHASQALALAQLQSDKVTTFENTLQETQSQHLALERAWQAFNENVSDEVLTNDVEHLLTIADQQLRLAGNVSNAIVALETAQLQLTRAHRPRFANLQQALNRDLDQLRAVPDIDISVQATRIARLMLLVDKAPLWVAEGNTFQPGHHPPVAKEVVPTSAAITTPAALPDNAPWWQRWRAEMAVWPTRVGMALKHELAGLIQVQRVDQPAALLLSSDQAQQLRATLRQRLLTAQLALLLHQPVFWKNELDSVNSLLKTYFDRNATDTLMALNLTDELAQTQIFTPLPSISMSASAMAALRASEGRHTSERQD